jgi:peptidyl-prolyl cis-trans isomerase SurA
MRFCLPALTAACLFSLASLPAQAQGLTLPKEPALSEALRQADFIVAVVGAEPITNHEVLTQVRQMSQQLAQQRQPLPAAADLKRLALERLINERAQLQLARETGIRVEETSVDQAEQTVAAQNQMDVPELRRQLAHDGLDLSKFRAQLRDQLMLTRLREREVDPRVRVSDQEVDQYLLEQSAKNTAPSTQQINIAQLLVAVPEDASAAQVARLQAKAEAALQRARAGEDFTSLVRELSDAADRANGGQLGLRTANRYPQLFLDAVQALSVGQVSGLVRSGAGFHILKLLEKKQPVGIAPMTVVQSHARHILLRPSAQVSEAQARDRLLDFKKRIESGQADFAALAREYSQDGSAAQGGDLGWSSPGMFVPEFETALNRLAPGQISPPLISRFGVHLIQLLERRNATLSPREQREMVRAMLREKKFAEVYGTWAQDVRARAYVELRDAPQ